MTETKENFTLSKLKDLSPNEAKRYITKYFVPLSTGQHAFLMDGKYVIREDQEIKRSYINRLPKDLARFYLCEYDDVRNITYELNKPVFFEDKINLCPSMKFEKREEYVIPDDLKPKLKKFLKYMKDILCSKDKDCYEFLLKWLSNMLKGRRNNSCLYLKGIQGTGKSSLFVMLSNHVIGKQLSLETGSDPIKTKFNEILAGKLLVCIEELENFTKGEWESISSTLKRMITSDNIVYQNKCTKSYEAVNLNNYILISNNDAVKDDDGRRFFILDISTEQVGNHDFYKDLYETCYNDEVGEALFNYLYDIDTDGFNPQAYPMTRSKLDSISKRLDIVYKFLKEKYVLRYDGFRMQFKELYLEFKSYCREQGSDEFGKMKRVSQEDFSKKLLEIGVQVIEKDDKRIYFMNQDDLLDYATRKYWIHETDTFVNRKKPSKKKPVDDSSDEMSDITNKDFSDDDTEKS